MDCWKKLTSELLNDDLLRPKRFGLEQALNWVISTEKDLNGASLQLSEPSKVTDGIDTIPRLQRQEFVLTCPYRIGETRLYTARPNLDDETSTLSRKLSRPVPKGVAVMQYTEKLIQACLGSDVRVRIHNDTVVPALYTESQPALDRKDPLNAFRVQGVVYQDNPKY